jgi:hypothetical protein
LGPALGSSTDSPRADAGAAAGGGAGGGAGGIGLVLIDRSLDLATPCMHSEHVLDLVLSCQEGPTAAAAAAAAAAGTVPGAVVLR